MRQRITQHGGLTSARNTYWSRGEVRSSRRPVKPEVAGSNPVGTANRGHQARKCKVAFVIVEQHFHVENMVS